MHELLGIKLGEELPQSKLTAEDVRILRDAHAEYKRLKKQADELSPSALAKKFGVTRYQVLRVVNYDDWKHVL